MGHPKEIICPRHALWAPKNTGVGQGKSSSSGCEAWKLDGIGGFFSCRSEEGKVSKVLASTFAHMLSKVGHDA